MQKKIVLLFFILGFSLAVAGTVSAADDSTGGAVVSQENLADINTSVNQTSSTNNSQLTDPYVVETGEHFYGDTGIQQAIDDLNTSDGYHILIEAGTYKHLNIYKSLTLIGMGANPTDTIIDGSGTGRVIYIPTGVTVTLINLTIQNGYADGGFLNPGGNGGGILNEGTLYLINCTIRNNTAGDGPNGVYLGHSDGYNGGNGGGIYNSGTLSITDSQIYKNRAGNGGNGATEGNGGNGGNGGAIYNTGTIIDISYTTINNNTAGNGGISGRKGILGFGGTGGTGGNGGAIYNTGTATITASSIYNNTAGNGGAGIDGSAIALDLTGYNGGIGGSGGAIYNTNHLEIYSTKIANNTAGNGGNGGNGAKAPEGVTPNKGGNGGSGGAGGNGGGIYNNNYLLITESTVTLNRSGKGGNGGNGGNGSNRWGWPIAIPSGSGGNGGNGGNAGYGAGIYHSGTYLEVTSNNLTNNTIGTPGTKGAAGLKGSGTGGTNGNDGTVGKSGTGGAVYLATNIALPQINYNRILDNTVPDIASYNGISVNAENNWWGTNFEGSSPSITGRVSSGVDADPWVMLRLIVPTHIYNGIPVQFIADLTQNSALMPVGGIIPNGVEANFTATPARGTVDSPQYTLNGQAPTIFTSTSSGPAIFTAKVDYQTVTVNQNVEPRAVLIFTKVVSNEHPNYGDSIHFILTVQNVAGPDNASGVNVFDMLPDGLVYQGYSSSPGTSYNNLTKIWTIGTLNVGSGAYLNITALVNATGFFNNTATLTQSTYPQDDVNRSATLNVDSAAILTITKTGDGPVNVGQQAGYTITVTNTGPDTAHNLVLHDYFNGQPEVTRTLGSLASGASWIFGISFLTDASMAGSNIANLANVTFDEYPHYSNTATGYVFVKEANVTLTKKDNTTNHKANIGDLVTFTITVHNNGPNNATNIVVTDLVPFGLEYIQSISDSGTYDPTTRTITWTAFNLDYGAPDVIRTFIATVNSDMAGNITGIINTANATFTEYPFNTTTADTAIYVPKADLYINSWASKTNPYVGETISITFKVGNNGPDPAENVVLTLPIPLGMEFIDVIFWDQGAKPTYDQVTRTLTWNLGIVLVDRTAIVRFKVLSAGTFVFAPSLTTDTYDPNITSNIQTVTINAQTVPEEVVNGQTVGMQTTGAPIAQLVLAVFMVLGGFLLPKRK